VERSISLHGCSLLGSTSLWGCGMAALLVSRIGAGAEGGGSEMMGSYDDSFVPASVISTSGPSL
jgi:hypothetical protein